MKKILLMTLACLLNACATSLPSLSGPLDPADQRHKPLIQFIQREMSAKNIPGLSIAVVDSQTVLWQKGFGEARRGQTAFTPSTVSNVGSVSKVFTAAGIMLLVEQGKVDLDKPLTAYLPDFKPATRGLSLDAVTIRSILCHESGLPSAVYHGFLFNDGPPVNYPEVMGNVLAEANGETLVQPAYQVFSYSNLGFSLLGLVIEAVSGQKFNDFMTQNIFTPLEMNHSSFLMSPDQRSTLARGYFGGKEVELPYIRDLPAGSLNSSSMDMTRYLQSFLVSLKGGSGLLKPSSMKEMLTVQNKNVPLDFDFKVGLTWWIVDFQSMPGEFAIGHGGDLPPFHALVALLPDRDLGIFIMVNGADGVGSFSLTDIMTEAFREFAREKGQKPLASALAAGPNSPLAPLPPALADKLAGYYATPAGLAEVRKDGQGLKVFAFGNWFDLNYRTDGSLTLSMKILGLFPLDLSVFKEIYATTDELDGKTMFNLRIKGLLFAPDVRIEPLAPQPSWVTRSGTYHQENPEPTPTFEEFRIGQDTDSPFYCFFRKAEGQWSKYPLRTLGDSEAVLEGQGRGLGETLRVQTDEKGEYLLYSGLKLRKI